MYTVYKTVCLVNDMFYIGVHKTDNPMDDYLGSGKRLKYAIKKSRMKMSNSAKANFLRDPIEFGNRARNAVNVRWTKE